MDAIQFTSEEFTGVLNSTGIHISMDGKGRCLDNVFVERQRGGTAPGAAAPHPSGGLPRVAVATVNTGGIDLRQLDDQPTVAVYPSAQSRRLPRPETGPSDGVHLKVDPADAQFDQSNTTLPSAGQTDRLHGIAQLPLPRDNSNSATMHK
jgi:hypothetical protein